MKLKKRWAAALLLVLVALHAAALAAGARVYDMADLFSAQEEKERPPSSTTGVLSAWTPRAAARWTTSTCTTAITTSTPAAR